MKVCNCADVHVYECRHSALLYSSFMCELCVYVYEYMDVNLQINANKRMLLQGVHTIMGIIGMNFNKNEF
jgi:hypothetical protein